MLSNFSIAFLGAVSGALLGKYVGWAIRAWPAHETFHCDYLHCATCEGGIKRGCYNAGTTQDKVYIIISALVAGLSVYFFGISIKTVISWVFSIACLIIAVVDYRFLIIPDRISIGGCCLGLVYAALCSLWTEYLDEAAFSYHIALLDAIKGFVLGYGGLYLLAEISRLILRKDAMGGGDVKLLGAIGAFAGWQAVLITIITASFLGSIGGILSIIYAKIRYNQNYKALSHMIPFGPYLCVAFLLFFYLGAEPFLELLAVYQNWVLS